MFCVFNLNKLLQDWRPTNNLFNSEIVFKLFFFPSHFISYFYMIKVKSPTACRTPNHTYSLYKFESKCVKKYRYESFLLILHYSVQLPFLRVASHSFQFAETIPQCNIPFNLIGILWVSVSHNRRVLINELVVRSYLIIELQRSCAVHSNRVYHPQKRLEFPVHNCSIECLVQILFNLVSISEIESAFIQLK